MKWRDMNWLMFKSYFVVFCSRTSKTTTMKSNGNERHLCQDRKPFQTCSILIRMDQFPRSIKVDRRKHILFRLIWHCVNIVRKQITFCLSLTRWCVDSSAPGKIFPKTPKIALTIDDVPQSEYHRRKSSGSSVNSTQSAIEPHIYDFQEYEKNIESSLIIRFVFLTTSVSLKKIH